MVTLAHLVQGCIAPFKAMTNQEQAEVYVDKIGRLDPHANPLMGIHTFDDPTAGLPAGY